MLYHNYHKIYSLLFVFFILTLKSSGILDNVGYLAHHHPISMEGVTNNIAMLIDWENIDSKKMKRNSNNHHVDFNILRSYAKSLGRLAISLAISGFNDREGGLVRAMHKNGIEPRFTMTQYIPSNDPNRKKTVKNAADIHLTVEALKIAYENSCINQFIIVSGDGGFIPLIRQLKCLGKVVHLVSADEKSCSRQLRDEVDSVKYYNNIKQGGE
jgi:uncharacterized LabA/DUF88 family protein